MTHLENWCQENILTVNVSKTKELILDFWKKQEKNYHTQATGGEGGLLQVPQRQHHRRILSSFHTLEKKACQHPDNLRFLWDHRLPLKGQQALLSAAVWEVLAAWRPKQRVWGGRQYWCLKNLRAQNKTNILEIDYSDFFFLFQLWPRYIISGIFYSWKINLSALSETI